VMLLLLGSNQGPSD